MRFWDIQKSHLEFQMWRELVIWLGAKSDTASSTIQFVWCEKNKTNFAHEEKRRYITFCETSRRKLGNF